MLENNERPQPELGAYGMGPSESEQWMTGGVTASLRSTSKQHRYVSKAELMARTLAILFFCTSLVLATALVGLSWYTYGLLKSINPAPPEPLPKLMPAAPVSPLQVRYQLDLPGRGEIFPALAAGNPSDYWPVAILSIANTSDRPLAESVAAEIPGWSRRSTRTVVIGPHETRALRITPELLPAAYGNTEMRRALLEVSASSPENSAAYSQTRPLFLHSVSDLYWGTKFANAQFIARWVTPHDPEVIKLISSARKYVSRGRLAGYHLAAPADENAAEISNQVRSQARAVFDAMRAVGISYVDSIFTFGNFASDAQRVRLPRETLQLSSANCIDVSVAFASAIENLGMDPVVVIVPGHAFTGVRMAPDSSEILYLDLTVLPNGTFDRAVKRAEYWMEKSAPDQVLVIDIAATRALGIYPIPEPLAQGS